MTGRPKADAFTSLIIEVFRVNGLLLAAGDRLTGPAGLSSARWQVLGVVEHGPSSVAHVARAMGLTRQSVQQTADALERDGFIEYVDNPHHLRAKLMAMTPKASRRSTTHENVRRSGHARWENLTGSGRCRAPSRCCVRFANSSPARLAIGVGAGRIKETSQMSPR